MKCATNEMFTALQMLEDLTEPELCIHMWGLSMSSSEI